MTTIIQRKIFIIGSNARLAKSLINYYKSYKLILPSRDIYENWSDTSSIDEISNYFQSKVTSGSIIFITSGILNSSQNEEIIEAINYQLPKNIILALKSTAVQIVTFGTILEKIRLTDNKYVKSKIKLSDYIKTSQKNVTPNLVHLRLHTLYGYDLPSPFMFLGQIFDSIKNKTDFYMSSGTQIREYHHLDDVAKAVDILLNVNTQGVSEITSGKGIQLKDLALMIYKEFNIEHLINIGVMDIKYKDKFSNDYQINTNLDSENFREPKQGVINYLKTIL